MKKLNFLSLILSVLISLQLLAVPNRAKEMKFYGESEKAPKSLNPAELTTYHTLGLAGYFQLQQSISFTSWGWLEEAKIQNYKRDSPKDEAFRAKLRNLFSAALSDETMIKETAKALPPETVKTLERKLSEPTMKKTFWFNTNPADFKYSNAFMYKKSAKPSQQKLSLCQKIFESAGHGRIKNRFLMEYSAASGKANVAKGPQKAEERQQVYCAYLYQNLSDAELWNVASFFSSKEFAQLQKVAEDQYGAAFKKVVPELLKMVSK